MTDPTGYTFISYRRSRRQECDRLVASLWERGIPTWRDVDDMNAEPTEDELRRVLADDQTAGVVLWITLDTASSDMIKKVEAPAAMARHGRNDGFFVIPVAAGGLDYADAAAAVANGTSFDAVAGWNIIKLESDPADDADIAQIANRILRQRLQAIDHRLPSDEPIRLALNTRQKAGHQPGITLSLDWSHRFGGVQNRVASPTDWDDRLLPALSHISQELQQTAPHRRVVAEGMTALPAVIALGYYFMAPAGAEIAWEQRMPNRNRQLWSLRTEPEFSGFEVHTSAGRLDARNLAVMVSVNNEVRAAVGASEEVTGPFRAYAHIKRADSAQSAMLDTAGQATDVARKVVTAIRNSRNHYSISGNVHLFIAAPAGLAMLIGQLSNTLGPIQTYEHIQSDATGHYVPAALLNSE